MPFSSVLEQARMWMSAGRLLDASSLRHGRYRYPRPVVSLVRPIQIPPSRRSLRVRGHCILVGSSGSPAVLIDCRFGLICEPCETDGEGGRDAKICVSHDYNVYSASRTAHGMATGYVTARSSLAVSVRSARRSARALCPIGAASVVPPLVSHRTW